MSTVVISAAPHCLVAPDVAPDACFDARPNFKPAPPPIPTPPLPSPDQYENIRVLRQCCPSRRPGTAAANLQTVMKGQLLTELARRAGRFAPRTRPQRHLNCRGGLSWHVRTQIGWWTAGKSYSGSVLLLLLTPAEKRNLPGATSVRYCSKMRCIFHIFSILDT